MQLVHVHKAKLNTIYKFFLRERKESENGEMHFLHNREKTPGKLNYSILNVKAISLYRIRARVSNSFSRSLILNFYSFLNICQKDSLQYFYSPSTFDLEKRAQVS